MDVEVPGEIEHLPNLVEALHSAWAAQELPSELRFVFDLALEEVFANLATHGRGPGLPLRVTVRLDVRDDCVVLEIRDDGVPFDPLAAPAPDLRAPLEDRPIGGLGLHLIRESFPDLRYEREGEENVLTLPRPLR
jgi:anti-sigma regulatory factor (Ser/Thr protein kinase)